MCFNSSFNVCLCVKRGEKEEEMFDGERCERRKETERSREITVDGYSLERVD